MAAYNLIRLPKPLAAVPGPASMPDARLAATAIPAANQEIQQSARRLPWVRMLSWSEVVIDVDRQVEVVEHLAPAAVQHERA